MTNELPNHAVMSLALTSFFGAQVTDVLNEQGDMERCVCIPIDRNDLAVGRNGVVYVQAYVTKTRNANRFGWTHYVRLQVSKDFYKKMKELGYEIPYIGSMKPSYMKYNENCNYLNKSEKVSKEDWL